MATAVEPSRSGGSVEHRPTYKQKVGHLRVDELGEITYKKTPSSTLMASLQLGLSHSIGSLEPKPKRDILMTDFDVIETVEFPSGGSGLTPGHKYKDFTFITYSPVAFRFFREAFQIKAEDYLLALCNQPMRELSNPGASGSLFYLSADDEFIVKTVQKKEAKFLQKLLPGYYLNLTQNKRTLLPKFFGLYQYRCGGAKIRIVVMNNLLPSSIIYHRKFDLKGSTYKRRASPVELAKKSPTCKDLDFMNFHPEGIILSVEEYDILMRTFQRDCQVLESFGIMDYSVLLGVHNVDEAIRVGDLPQTPTEVIAPLFSNPPFMQGEERIVHKKERSYTLTLPTSTPSRRKNFSIINNRFSDQDTDFGQAPPSYYPEGYIQGHTEQGDRLLLYLGIIDILQSYKFKKKLEHGLKAIITDGDTISVHNPTYYSGRFQTFMKSTVFKRERVRIRPRRNSSIVQSKSGRKQATTIHIGRTPNRTSQDSEVAQQNSTQELSSNLFPSLPNSPHVNPDIVPLHMPPTKEQKEAVKNVSDIQTKEDQEMKENSVPVDYSVTTINSSTPIDDDESESMIQTSISIIVPENSTSPSDDTPSVPILVASTD